MTINQSADAQRPQPASGPAAARTKRSPRRPGAGPTQSPRLAQTPQSAQSPQPAQSSARQTPPAAGGTLDARVAPPQVRIGSPASLLAVIPGLLGFEPGHSIVVVGTEPPGAQVRVTLRYDLPDPGRPRASAALAGHAVSVLAAQGITAAVVVGYGADAAVSPVVGSLREQAAEAGITMTELLRAENGRYWSYVCDDPECCPVEGTPFDVAGHPAARALASAGGRVLADRDELAATLTAAGGQLGAAMRRATAQARAQVVRCVARLDRAGMRVSPSRLTAALGPLAVADAVRRYREGEEVSNERAAWLIVALREVRVRDDAWARMDPEHRAAHLRLWTHLTRLARPGYVAAPAALLAFVAWQDGNGALANVALDRALADNPKYSMARLLREALDSGAPPSLARVPMTPEEVAAAYDEAEATVPASARSRP
jgi:Domain of unknown function (DUF4192)